MTKVQRRKIVAIAKDVLAQMKFLRVSRGTYYLEMTSDVEDILEQNRGRSLKNLMPRLLTPKKPCEVCARGAMFLSYVNLYNNVRVPTEVGTVWNGLADMASEKHAEEINPLAGIVEPTQLGLIETAFECDDQFGFGNRDDDVIAAVRFGHRYTDARHRLRAIMRNIIKNDGEFVPYIPKKGEGK